MSQNESTRATKNRNELKGDQKRAKTALNKPKRAKRCPKTTQNDSKQPKTSQNDQKEDLKWAKTTSYIKLHNEPKRARTTQNKSK